MDARKVSILPLFPLLSSHDAPTRLDASLSILSSLRLASPAGTPTEAGSPAPGIEDADTPYAIKRLVKGLASSNEASRQGFAVALTELLARLPTDQSATVLPLIISTTTPTAAMDSRESRELLFARLLGLHAVIRAGVLYRAETTNGETFKEVILALLALAGSKSWMMEPAYWVMIEAIRTLLEMDKNAIPAWKDELTAWAIQRLLNDSREKARGFGPEKIALVLLLQSYGVEADYATVLSPTFPTGNPLARASLTSLAQALKGSIEVDSAAPAAKAPKMGSNAVKTAKGSSATPGAAPHFVWSEIFEIYFPDSANAVRKGLAGGKEGRAKWTEVWRVLVDQSLFGPTSLSLKATGFGLLSLAITRLPAFEIPALFGEGVMRTLGNHLRKSGEVEKTLARVAEKVVAFLPPFLAANPSVALPLLKALVAPPHGSHSFDARTVEKVVAKLDLKGVRGWVKYLKDFVLGDEAKLLEDGEADAVVEVEEEKTVASRRMWAFDQLLHVAKSGALPKDDETLAGLLEFFAVLGWFEVRKSGKGARSYVPVPAFNDILRNAARSRFFSVLTSLPIVANGQTWLSRALALLDNLVADSKHFNLAVEADEEVVAAREEIKAFYVKLTGDDERKKTIRGLIEGVLLLSFDEGEEALEVIEQLKDCVANLFPDIVGAPAKASGSDDVMDEEDGEVPEPATVLIDLLLELLHRPSAFIKSVAQSVFTGFSVEIGEQAMDLLLDQIRPEEDDVPEDDDSEDEGDVDMTNGDAEASTSKAKSNGKKAAVVNDSDSEDSGDEEEDDDAQVDEDFRNDLLAALQAAGGDALEAALDVEEGDDAEEELLNDDQMLAMDEKLADIFRLQGGGKKGKKAQRTDDLHYRLRILDLLESLVKQRTANPLLVFVILPLFHIAQRAVLVEQELQSKAIKLLRLIVSSRKDAPAPEDPQSALDALTELHAISQTIEVPELANLCSQSCIFLVKAALASPNADAETSSSITALYTDSFELYLSKKNSKTRAQPALTIEFARRSPACAWSMFASVVASAGGVESSAVNAYRRMQGFEVAQALLTSYAALKTDQSKSDILSLLPAYRQAIYTVLSSPLTSETSTFDAARIKELGKLALAAVRITATVSTPALVASIWKADEFSSLADKFKESDRFKNAGAIQNLMKQLVTLVAGASAKSSTKRKAEEPEVEKKKSKKEKVIAEVAAIVEPVAEVIENVAESSKEKKSKKSKRAKA